MFRIHHLKLPALISGILLWFAFGCSQAFATKKEWQDWRTLVSDADFVGIIECTTAGCIVARYQVVESWKGAATGQGISLRIPPDYFGPRPPTVLCGQRFFAIARRNEDATSSGPGFPLWWRHIPADYTSDFGQGMVEVKAGDFVAKQNIITEDHSSLAAFKAHVIEFLATTPEQQERARLLNGGLPRQPAVVTTPSDLSKAQDAPVPAPTPEQIKQAENELLQPTSPSFPWKSVEIMTIADPVKAANFLRVWKFSASSDSGGYEAGSRFGRKCSKERSIHLTSLLDAEDPWIKTAAAVYLCFDNPVLGKEKLRAFSAHAEAPGLWAAVVLASRGDKSGLPRALEFFKDSLDIHDSFRKDMRLQLSVLLSNSAKHSGLPQPPAYKYVKEEDEESECLRYFEAMKSWWEDNREKMVLFDPWLEVLEKQKVD